MCSLNSPLQHPKHLSSMNFHFFSFLLTPQSNLFHPTHFTFALWASLQKCFHLTQLQHVAALAAQHASERSPRRSSAACRACAAAVSVLVWEGVVHGARCMSDTVVVGRCHDNDRPSLWFKNVPRQNQATGSSPGAAIWSLLAFAWPGCGVWGSGEGSCRSVLLWSSENWKGKTVISPGFLSPIRSES